MAQSALEAAQGACVKIGANKISALNGTDKVSVALNDRIDICKRHLLRMHPWNFAVKRDILTPFPGFAISNATLVSSELVEITHAAATGANAIAANDWVTIAGVVGATEANGTWKVASAPATTTTRVTARGVTSLTTYVADTGDTIRKSPAFDLGYLYTLPSDCLRVLRINDSCPTDYRIEAGKVAADTDELALKYIYDVSDYTTMSIDFYECLQWYLALDVSYLVTQSSQLREQLEDGFRKSLAKARFDDATEDPAEQLGADDWILARHSGSDSWLDVGRY